MPSAQIKANHLQQTALNFIDRYGHLQELGADTVTALRREVDQEVKDFGAEPAVRSAANLTRGVLSKSIQDADPTGELEPLGQELNKFYTLLGYAEPRQFAKNATSALPLGIKDAGTAIVGNAFGGLPGAVVLTGAQKALNTNMGTAVASKAYQVAGAGMKKVAGVMPAIAATAGGALASGGSNLGNMVDGLNGNGANGANNPEELPQSVLSDSARDPKTGLWSVPTDIQPLQIPGDDPSMTLQKYNQEAGQLVNNPASAQQLKDKFDATTNLRQQYLNQNTPAGANQFVNQDFPARVDQVNKLSEIIRKYGTATGPQNLSQLVQYAEAQHDPAAAVAQGLMSDLKAVSSHQAAGRFTEFDASFLNNMPSPTDSKAAALAKIDTAMKIAADQYRRLAPFVKYSVANGNSGANTAVLAAPQQQTTAPVAPQSTQQTGVMPNMEGASVNTPNGTIPPLPNYVYQNGQWVEIPAVQ